MSTKPMSTKPMSTDATLAVTATVTLSRLCIERVRTSRQRLAGSPFNLPDPQRCARYALTEGAETDDEFLRGETDDVRNNNRLRDARAEWGQTGYMILSGLIQLQYIEDIFSRPCTQTDPLWMYGAMMVCLGNYVQEVAIGHPFAKSGQSLCWAWMYWLRYAELRGWDAGDLIDETCGAFEGKHAAYQGEWCHPKNS